MSEKIKGCDYTGHDFGASYPDSTCIDGYLWDLDSCDVPGGPLCIGGDEPCPQCNHEQFLERCCDDAAEAGAIAFHDGKERRFPSSRENLRYPEDFEALEKSWLNGWDGEKLAAEIDTEER